MYKYDLRGSSITSVPGAKGDTATMSLDASVEVQAGPQCTFTLKVTKAVITGADGKVSELLSIMFGDRHNTCLRRSRCLTVLEVLTDVTIC